MPDPGTVQTVAPLTVLLDGSTTDQPAANMSSVDLVIGDRVDIEPIGPDTTSKQLHVLGVDRSGVPTGCTMIWWVPTLPPGWMIIDGIPKSRTTYAALFAVWGTYYGDR